MTTLPLPAPRQRGAGRLLRQRARSLAQAAVTPLDLDDLLDHFHPLRRGAELSGNVVEVRPEVTLPAAADLTIEVEPVAVSDEDIDCFGRLAAMVALWQEGRHHDDGQGRAPMWRWGARAPLGNVREAIPAGGSKLGHGHVCAGHTAAVGWPAIRSDEDGVIRYRNDIYGRDARLERALGTGRVAMR